MLSPRSGNQLHCCSSLGSTIENQIYFVFFIQFFFCTQETCDGMIFSCLPRYLLFRPFFLPPLQTLRRFLHLENNTFEANVKHAGQQATECVCLIEVSRFNDLNVCSFTVRGSGDRILIMKFCDCISLGKFGLIIISRQLYVSHVKSNKISKSIRLLIFG